MGAEFFGDFFLDEEDDGCGFGGGGEEFFDDGGGDVVGDVAGDDVRFGDFGEVEFEEILVDDGEVFAGERFGEVGGEALVEFDGEDFREAFEQAGGEGAEARADFEAELDVFFE